MPGKTDDEIRCSFCRKTQNQVRRLIASSNNVFICDEYVDLCGEILKEGLDRHEGEGLDLNNINLLKSKEIKSFLGEYVIGQKNTRKVLFVAVYNHRKRVASRKNMDANVQKSNILMLGPTGFGKTYLTQTLTKVLDVPLAIADTTALAEAGYVGEDVENVLLKLIQAAGYDISKAEYGIIYVDEIDKIAKRSGNVSITRDASGEGVQQALLKILEGTVASVPPQDGRKHPHQELLQTGTTNILLICGGAFGGLEKIVKNRLDVNPVGSNSDTLDRSNMDIDGLLRKVPPQDLTKFGLILESIERVPVTVSLDMLTEEVLVRVLSEPRNALTEQYQRLFELNDVKLRLTQDALLETVKLASGRRTGARGLRSTMESIMMDLMYEMPSDSNIRVCTIMKGLIGRNRKPEIVYRNATVPRRAMT